MNYQLRRKFLANDRFVTGFTLIELLVVTAIIAMLTAIILPNYRSGDRQLALQRSANKVAQDLRRAQQMSMSAAFSSKTGMTVPAGGYGTRFKNSTSSYVLYGDADNNHEYSALSDYLIETIPLEENIIVQNIQVDWGSGWGNKNNAFITFVPPDPQVYIVTPGDPLSYQAQIIIAPKEDATKTKIIYINKAGLITVK